MHNKKTPFLCAGVEGRQSRADGSGGDQTPAADSPLVGHGDVHSFDGCSDRVRLAMGRTARDRGMPRVARCARADVDENY